MVKSRPFVAVSVLTALSVAISSVASARSMTPQVSTDNAYGARMTNPNAPHTRSGDRHHRYGNRDRSDDGSWRRGASHGAGGGASVRGDGRDFRQGAQPSAQRPESGRAARQPMQFRRGPDPAPVHDRNGGDRRDHGAAQAQRFQGNAFRSAPPARRDDHDIGGPPARQAYRGDSRGAPHQGHRSYDNHGKQDYGPHGYNSDGYSTRGYGPHGYSPHGYSTYRDGGPPPRVVVLGHRYPPAWYYAPPHRRYYYRNVWIVRPYGHWYRGYGHYYTYDDAYPWLAFTAVTLGVLTLFTVAQQRAYEQAQIDATTAPVGSSIRWNEGNAYGAVSVLRDGQSSSGRYCREFQQTVAIGGRSEQAYGTACMQPDGAWQIVDTR
jgi:surface antigen